MLDKIKGLGAQVATRANDAVEGLATTVKGGVESLTETINEKAVRASTAQMCSILEIALDEIRQRPIAERPLTLTATVNFGIASLDKSRGQVLQNNISCCFSSPSLRKSRQLRVGWSPIFWRWLAVVGLRCANPTNEE